MRKHLVVRGDVYLARGDRDNAIADYTQAIATDPKLVSAYINRGVAYLGKSSWDPAIADFTTVISLDPKTHVMAYLNRGLALQSKG